GLDLYRLVVQEKWLESPFADRFDGSGNEKRMAVNELEGLDGSIFADHRRQVDGSLDALLFGGGRITGGWNGTAAHGVAGTGVVFGAAVRGGRSRGCSRRTAEHFHGYIWRNFDAFGSGGRRLL